MFPRFWFRIPICYWNGSITVTDLVPTVKFYNTFYINNSCLQPGYVHTKYKFLFLQRIYSKNEAIIMSGTLSGIGTRVKNRDISRWSKQRIRFQRSRFPSAVPVLGCKKGLDFVLIKEVLKCRFDLCSCIKIKRTKI
jgi:hypothetical protein